MIKQHLTRLDIIAYDPSQPYYRDLCKLTKEFTKRFGHSNFCIAGGAIRDLILSKAPRDIDIFLLENPADRTWDYTTDLNPDHKNKSSVDECLGSYIWNGYSIQICYIPDNHHITTLLNGFDFEQCMFAMDVFNNVYTLTDQYYRMSLTGSQILLNPARRRGSNSAEKSLARAFRFRDRYGWTIPTDTLTTLCQGVIDDYT